jgi:predicted Zn finger-like uncharacterized protein
MRFECDSCHAKYKISDDKVRGRVVRFPCRRCEHKILIDGRQHDTDVTVPGGAAYHFDAITKKSEPVSQFSRHEAATARASRPSSAPRRVSTPARRRPPSVPPRRPSAASRRVSSAPLTASSGLAGQHPGLAPPVPATVATGVGDLPEWHVSINDVPIGPIRLEEMSHKIDAGAVSEYSLVWRNGFDEWRPLATVPELMSMLHERRHSGPPSRSSFSSMPPFVDTRASLSEPSPLAAAPVSPSSFSGLASLEDEDEIAPLADALQPELPDSGLSATSQPPAPIGPKEVFNSSPQLGSYSGLRPTPDEEVSVPSVPPEQATSSAEPTRKLSLGVLALILALTVFSAVLAYVAFDRFGGEMMQKLVGAKEAARSAMTTPRPVPADRASTEPAGVLKPTGADAAALHRPEARPEPGAPEASEAEIEAEAEVEAESEGEAAATEAPPAASSAPLVPPPDPKDDSPKIAPMANAKPRPRRSPPPAPVAAPASAAEPETDLAPAEQKLLDQFGSGANTAPATIDIKDPGTSTSDHPPLDGDAVRATVTANKARLQRCYERAIRGQQSAPTVRLDISVMVASSGRVKTVTSEGSGPGGLAACVEASVRRWRFPASAEGGPAKFPVVFSAN